MRCKCGAELTEESTFGDVDQERLHICSACTAIRASTGARVAPETCVAINGGPPQIMLLLACRRIMALGALQQYGGLRGHFEDGTSDAELEEFAEVHFRECVSTIVAATGVLLAGVNEPHRSKQVMTLLKLSGIEHTAITIPKGAASN